MNTPQELPFELFVTMPTDKSLRNNIAFPVTCCDERGKFLYKKCNSYPKSYIVNEHHTALALAEIAKDKAVIIAANTSNIVFRGMGGDFEPIAGYANNHRFRAEFTNVSKREFFLEFTTNEQGALYCTHSIDRDLERECNEKKVKNQPYNNYAKLEGKLDCGATLAAILHIINKNFKCAFEAVVIDNYTTSCGEPLNVSPERKKK